MFALHQIYFHLARDFNSLATYERGGKQPERKALKIWSRVIRFFSTNWPGVTPLPAHYNISLSIKKTRVHTVQLFQSIWKEFKPSEWGVTFSNQQWECNAAWRRWYHPEKHVRKCFIPLMAQQFAPKHFYFRKLTAHRFMALTRETPCERHK